MHFLPALTHPQVLPGPHANALHAHLLIVMPNFCRLPCLPFGEDECCYGIDEIFMMSGMSSILSYCYFLFFYVFLLISLGLDVYFGSFEIVLCFFDKSLSSTIYFLLDFFFGFYSIQCN